MLTLWHNDEAFIAKYLKDSPGYYTTGDAGTLDEHGYLHIMTRTDDVLNCAGHRLSAGRIEEVVNSHPNIVESACIALADPIKTEVPFAFIIPADEADISANDLIKQANGLVRQEIGAFSSLGGGIVLSKLPKTRSGKILRGTLKKIANKVEYKVPATIEDESVLDYIKELLEEHFHSKK
jgi:propionyl-CoA synthetase